MEGTGWNRREFVRAAALLGTALGLPGCVTATALDPALAPTIDELALANTVADLVIPATETPGAAEADVGAFVLLALAHGLEGARDPLAAGAITAAIRPHLRADGSLDHMRWLASALPAPSPSSLAALDAAAFANQPDAQPWRLLKRLILTGYYTSQIGGSQELQYAAAPGRFDPMVPLTPETRAYSNEWNGVEFG
ncbi:MAG: gluconate 2-dehydrogenase subunit 3 family protein [Erythrobacter sp.]|nr:gluconate 2-dehydrogenase subunit 3 family protein [Erythrobacter sp.]